MYNPTTRLLALLELLQARGRVSGAELARRLEVEERSVRRYVTMLQDLGIPIDSERGRYGGYQLRRGYKLPPLLFTEDEGLALTLGLLAAQRMGLTGAAPAIEGALAKVDRVLPDAARNQIRDLQETIVIDVPRTSPPQPMTLLGFSSALRDRRQVRIDYQSGDSVTHRAVDTYGIIYRSGRWYVVGYCHLREDVRVFRMDRVTRIEPTDDPYVRPDDFDAREHLLRSLASAWQGWSIEVFLQAPAERAAQWVSPVVGELEDVEGGCLLRMRTDTLDWAAIFLMDMPFPVVVHKPPELLEALDRLRARIGETIDRAELAPARRRGRSSSRGPAAA
jgi:predicted DNA-binding transcriptional regulator YafY